MFLVAGVCAAEVREKEFLGRCNMACLAEVRSWVWERHEEYM